MVVRGARRIEVRDERSPGLRGHSAPYSSRLVLPCPALPYSPVAVIHCSHGQAQLVLALEKVVQYMLGLHGARHAVMNCLARRKYIDRSLTSIPE